MMNTDDTTTESVTLKLEKLAGKQNIWQKMTPMQKLPYLEATVAAFEKLGPKGFEVMLGQKAADLKGVNGEERDIVTSEESMLMAVVKTYIDSLMTSYKILAGTSDPRVKDELMSYKRWDIGDQVIANVYPLLQEEKEGPLSDYQGEIWFQKGVKPEDVEAFQFDALQDKKDGVLCILGAGNYAILTISDVLHGLFIRGRVVFCKMHPLRPYLQDFVKLVFAKLYQDGFLDSEPEINLERSKAILQSDFVTSVHMTGGKATHDLIVWGPSDQQAQNKANKTPVLQAEMTSELGAATPYIMTPAEYTPEELEHQAQTLIGAKWFNGGASCNAPQNIVVSKHWKQRDAFISALQNAWENTPPIASYYPGAPQRWKNFAQEYNGTANVVHSKHPYKVDAGEKRKQTEAATITVGGADEVIDESHLPLLMVFVDVDLSTVEGQAKAMNEYALKNEVFAPAIVITTIHDDRSTFMEKAVELSNEYMFGSLSCSVAVPASADGSAEVENAIKGLKYGAIVTNAWSGSSFLVWQLCWGGIFGEKLESVESGIGKVVNSMLFSNVEKCVLRTPPIHQMHFNFCKTPEDIVGFNRYLACAFMGLDPSSENYSERFVGRGETA